MRNVPIREWECVLKHNGYSKSNRGKGSHVIWVKKGCNPISVPSAKKEVNGAQAYGIIKKYNLITED